VTLTVPQIFDADSLTAACQRVLDAIVAAAAALPDAVTIPDRQILSTAGVTWDCQMVFVAALSVQLGIPESASEPQLGGLNTWPQGVQMWTVTVEAGIVRQASAEPADGVPSYTPPTPDQYLTDLTAVSSDTAVLFNAAAALGGQQMQFGPVPQRADMLATQGTFQGVAGNFTFEMFPAPGAL
jgi:hypothetical protein